MLLSQIFAVAENGAIGKDNKLIWHLPKDLKFFKLHTTGHPVIMGRKTFESLGKPLPARTNIIITKNRNYEAAGCIVVTSLAEAIEEAKKVEDEEIFIIGGAQIFRESLPFCNKIYLTEVKAEVQGDVFYNFDKKGWEEVFREDHFKDEKHAFDFSLTILQNNNRNR
jgi:dihydrofolate reductase